MTMPLAPSGKEPWLAVNLSIFCAGLGHCYTGSVARGLGWLLIQILLWLAWGWLVLYGDINVLLLALGLLVVTLGMTLLSSFDAYHCARLKNSAEFEDWRKSSKDPWLAVFLSRFVLGGGHLYVGKTLFGVVLIVGWGLGILFPILGLFNFLIGLPLVAISAYRSVPAWRQKAKLFLIPMSIALVLVPLLVSLPVALGVRTFVAEARFIPSESMVPTLAVGDRLIIDKLTYNFQKPQRGDLLLFLPNETLRQQQPSLKEAFLHRLIGLPGETVEVRQGAVYINSQPLAEPYIKEKPTYEMKPKLVPADAYFVLGDNRNSSYDSHFWGYVPRSLIIGRATKIFYPFNRSRSFRAAITN
jgi:signal peptidase I